GVVPCVASLPAYDDDDARRRQPRATRRQATVDVSSAVPAAAERSGTHDLRDRLSRRSLRRARCQPHRGPSTASLPAKETAPRPPPLDGGAVPQADVREYPRP